MPTLDWALLGIGVWALLVSGLVVTVHRAEVKWHEAERRMRENDRATLNELSSRYFAEE